MSDPAVAWGRAWWGVLAVTALALLALWILPGHVRFAHGVELVTTEIPREVAPGGTLAITLRYRVREPLRADDLLFIHVEDTEADSGVERIHEEVEPPVPATRWGDQAFTQTVRLSVPASTPPGRFVVLGGFYDPKSSERLPLLEPRMAGDRVFLGMVDLVPGDPDPATRERSAGDLRFENERAPWLPWLAGLGAVATFAVWARSRRRAEGGTAAGSGAPAGTWRRAALDALPAVPLLLGVFALLEFVKDDAYISFRYAHNLVTGQGLVFNAGERVEGFTNFLWVLIVAPFEALGWDLFQVCEVLGTGLAVACLVVTGRMTAWLGGTRAAGAQIWGAFWLGSCSSLALWSKSGLEQPLAALLPIAGAMVLWPARESRAPRRYLVAGLVMGAGCMTRPELHLLAVLVGLPLVVDAARARRVGLPEGLYVAGILAVTVPCHTFRWLYYGSLIPNTFYVKTGSGPEVWHAGLDTLLDMLRFNHMGALALLAPLAFASRARRVEKATLAVVSASFMAYYVRVGVDEMTWHRLYLPALPMLCVLAALGAENLVQIVAGAFRPEAEGRARAVASGITWVVLLVAASANFRVSYLEGHGFDGHGDLAGTYHPDLGKFLVRHERPHALVAFQDMGSTPYHAPDIDFLDFYGLVDATVAHARHDAGMHTFLSAPQAVQDAYDARMREYFFGRNPEWVIFTIYPPGGDEQTVADEFAQDPTGGAFGDAYRDNDNQFALWDDPRFRDRYVPVRTWPRSRAYYLALFRRKDLWLQTPREVVLDAPPPGISGARATLEGGLELLGSEVTPTAPERHEVFITTWWRLPGPMSPDVYFFSHFSRRGSFTSGDHVPGDWMYPADRWVAGQILEDRTLLQLPPFDVGPGRYAVYVGAYHRAGAAQPRLHVVSGAHDGEDRVPLGDVLVTPLHPLVQQLIPPTRLDTMRRYPDRIVDSGRRAPP